MFPKLKKQEAGEDLSACEENLNTLSLLCIRYVKTILSCVSWYSSAVVLGPSSPALAKYSCGERIVRKPQRLEQFCGQLFHRDIMCNLNDIKMIFFCFTGPIF